MMGCDIHAYVEYVSFLDRDGEGHWKCLIADAGGRDYGFFSLLARCGRGQHRPVFDNRGYPQGASSSEVFGAYHLCVKDEFKDVDGYTGTAQADQWVANGSSADVEVRDRRYVTHPDYHSVSWLTHDELAQVIAAAMFDNPDYTYDDEWDAVLAAMRALEERGKQTRLVFWFDN